MIEVRDLSKRYGAITALDRLSLSIEKGEIVGLLGPNGAGKSTTMRILTGFLTPTGGTAKVQGLDIIEDSLKIRRKIGYLPENNPLYDDMTVEGNLRFFARIRGVSASERSQAMGYVVEKCGLREVFRRPISELSRGYRQRVGLAQSIIHNPDILIFDEPTTGLDPKQIIEIRELIRELGHEKTVILSSHILPEVSQTCRRICIINQGKLVAQGAPTELEKMAQGEPIIYLKVEGVPSVVSRKISECGFIQKVRVVEEEGPVARYELRVEAVSNEICKKLFHLVQDNHWELVELRPERATLEDVFIKLVT